MKQYIFLTFSRLRLKIVLIRGRSFIRIRCLFFVTFGPCLHIWTIIKTLYLRSSQPLLRKNTNFGDTAKHTKNPVHVCKNAFISNLDHLCLCHVSNKIEDNRLGHCSKRRPRPPPLPSHPQYQQFPASSPSLG